MKQDKLDTEIHKTKRIKCDVCNQEFDTDVYNISDFEFYATKICEKCFKAWIEGINEEHVLARDRFN